MDDLAFLLAVIFLTPHGWVGMIVFGLVMAMIFEK